MADTSKRNAIAALLRETGSAHHRAFIQTGGDDPDWARWYAEHLAAPLGRLFGREVDTGDLECDLTTVDREHRALAERPDWAPFYADWLLARFGAR